MLFLRQGLSDALLGVVRKGLMLACLDRTVRVLLCSVLALVLRLGSYFISVGLTYGGDGSFGTRRNCGVRCGLVGGRDLILS